MPLLRPLDPAFPIERQITIDASPVVLVNVFTLDRADEETFLKAWQDDARFMKQQPGFISTQLTPCDRRQPGLFELCGLGNERRLPGRVHASGISGEDRGLSVLGRSQPASVSEGRGPRHLRRLAQPRSPTPQPCLFATFGDAVRAVY